MILQFLVQTGAVSIGFLTGSGGDSERVEEEEQCFVMMEMEHQQQQQQHCGRRPECLRRVPEGRSPLPDIVVSNTPPASPIRRVTSCPYFFFPEDPKADVFGDSCPLRGHPQNTPGAFPPSEASGVLTPPLTPSATSDEFPVWDYPVRRSGNPEEDIPNFFVVSPVRRDRWEDTDDEDGEEEFGVMRVNERVALCRDMCQRCDYHHYHHHHHHHHHRRHHHHYQRTCQRHRCRHMDCHRVPHQEMRRALPMLHWGVPPPHRQCHRQCLRHSGRDGRSCLRCLEFWRSKDERHRWRVVGQDLRNMADHFQALHSKLNGKGDQNWISLSLLIPVALTRCLSASILCLIRWRFS